MAAYLRAFLLLLLFLVYCAIAVHEESNEEQARSPSTNKVERGWKRKKNIWNKQFTKAAIKKTRSELQGEELAHFNEKVQRFQNSRAARDAKRYEVKKLQVEQKLSETVSSGSKRKYSELEVRAANRAALGQIPTFFQPHKQSKLDR